MKQTEQERKGEGPAGRGGWLKGGAVLLLLAGLAAFFILAPSQAERGADGAAGTGSVDSDTVLPVRTVKAVSGTVQDYIRISGDIQAASTINVMPDTAGKLVRRLVRTGDYVRKGQVLAQVDPSRPGASFSLSPVEAPISGTVTEILAEVGETVSQGAPAARIGQLDQLEIEAFVSEKFVNRVEQGQRAYVHLESLSGRSLAAEVAEIAPVVNPKTRTLQVTLVFTQGPDGPQGLPAGAAAGVKAGMLADISLIIEEHAETVKVPRRAVLERGGGYFVYRIRDGRAEKADVVRGIQSRDAVEIRSGLEPGDRVAVSGTSRLADGLRVRVLEELEPLPAAGQVDARNREESRNLEESRNQGGSHD